MDKKLEASILLMDMILKTVRNNDYPKEMQTDLKLYATKLFGAIMHKLDYSKDLRSTSRQNEILFIKMYLAALDPKFALVQPDPELSMMINERIKILGLERSN